MRNTHSATATFGTLEQRVLCLAMLHAQPEPPDPGYQIFPLTFPMHASSHARWHNCNPLHGRVGSAPPRPIHTRSHNPYAFKPPSPLDHKSNDNESRTRCHSQPWLHTFMHDDNSLHLLSQPTTTTHSEAVHSLMYVSDATRRSIPRPCTHKRI